MKTLNEEHIPIIKQIETKATCLFIGPMPIQKKPLINKEVPIILIDGGIKHKEAQHPYQLSLGDQDSSQGRPLDITLSQKKDYSDFAYALSLISNKKESFFYCAGLLGGRRDHEWFNFLEVLSFLKDKENIQFSFEDRVSLVSKGDYHFHTTGLFSLSSLQGASIELKGSLGYPYKGELKAFSSQGLSNISQGKWSLQTDSPLILFWGDQ